MTPRYIFARESVRGVLRVRLLAELSPIVLGDLDAIMLRRPLDVREGEVAVGIGDILDLIEARAGVLDMPRVGQRLLALLGEGVDAVR